MLYFLLLPAVQLLTDSVNSAINISSRYYLPAEYFYLTAAGLLSLFTMANLYV